MTQGRSMWACRLQFSGILHVKANPARLFVQCCLLFTFHTLRVNRSKCLTQGRCGLIDKMAFSSETTPWFQLAKLQALGQSLKIETIIGGPWFCCGFELRYVVSRLRSKPAHTLTTPVRQTHYVAVDHRCHLFVVSLRTFVSLEQQAQSRTMHRIKSLWCLNSCRGCLGSSLFT
jgi:hypothetical protein